MGKFFLYGGSQKDGQVSAQIWEFDFISFSWLPLVPTNAILPRERYGHAAVFWNNNLVVFGGINGDADILCDLAYFDINSNTWTSYKLTICRSQMGWTLSKNTLYIFGGKDESFGITSSLVTIDLNSRNAQVLETTGSKPLATTGSSLSVVASDSLALFGGVDVNSRQHGTMYVYSTTTNTWSTPSIYGAAPIPVSGALMIAYPDTNSSWISGGLSSTEISLQTMSWNREVNKWVYETDSIQISNHHGSLFTLPTCIRNSISTCPLEARPLILMYGGRNADKVLSSTYVYRIGTNPRPICKAGNYLSKDSLERDVCVPCPPDSYNANGDGICLECPQGAFCPGGNAVNAQLGYWQGYLSSNNRPISEES